MEWVAIVVMAILLVFAHREGIKTGEKKAQIEAAEEVAVIKEEAVNEEVDDMQSLSRVEQLRAIATKFLRRLGNKNK